MLGSQAGVQILKERRLKIDICFWQKFFIGYESTNQYQVYNQRIGAIHIIQNLFVNKQNLYHREVFNNWNYSENDWTEIDDFQFAETNDIANLEAASFLVPDDSFDLLGDSVS